MRDVFTHGPYEHFLFYYKKREFALGGRYAIPLISRISLPELFAARPRPLGVAGDGIAAGEPRPVFAAFKFRWIVSPT